MRVLIRADGGSELGAGHVMRCLALAREVRVQGGHVLIASAVLDGNLAARVAAAGVDSTIKSVAPGSAADVAWLVEQARRFGTDWVVLDGYRFDANYQRAVHAAGLRQLFIDDFGHCADYCAELILNQNLSATDTLYSARQRHTTLLLGTTYVLLRPEFEVVVTPDEVPARANKVLVTIGASDPVNASALVAQALTLLDDSALEVRLVIGPANRHAQALRAAVRDPRIALIASSDHMVELMTWAELAISGAGSTTYELCRMGVPSLLIVIATNQLEVAAGHTKAGSAISLGWHHTLSVDALSRHIDDLRDRSDIRRALSAAGRALVDGLGARRVVAAMSK